jgi:hypothetical protein
MHKVLPRLHEDNLLLCLQNALIKTWSYKLPYHMVSPGMLDLLTCNDWVGEPQGNVSLNGCHLPFAQVFHVPLTPVGFGSGMTH